MINPHCGRPEILHPTTILRANNQQLLKHLFQTTLTIVALQPTRERIKGSLSIMVFYHSRGQEPKIRFWEPIEIPFFNWVILFGCPGIRSHNLKQFLSLSIIYLYKQKQKPRSKQIKLQQKANLFIDCLFISFHLLFLVTIDPFFLFLLFGFFFFAKIFPSPFVSFRRCHLYNENTKQREREREREREV
eukprot:TRINITY_DN24853_c1_g1_i2.p1 TRINITY_DN24853_c1_g1~~TRINITY_DN24853_c1_g1_i2.p1  ORF type:complete len:189 (-),score=17.81 TRINITY_DN24853_c1_g1_i2:303-869(-)